MRGLADTARANRLSDFLERLDTDTYAFVTDIGMRAGYQLANVALAFKAEGAAKLALATRFREFLVHGAGGRDQALRKAVEVRRVRLRPAKQRLEIAQKVFLCASLAEKHRERLDVGHAKTCCPASIASVSANGWRLSGAAGVRCSRGLDGIGTFAPRRPSGRPEKGQASGIEKHPHRREVG